MLPQQEPRAMFRLLFALALLVPSLAARAQSGTAEPPIETAGPLAIWIFALLFLGAIAAYVYFTWRGERKPKDAAGSKRG